MAKTTSRTLALRGALRPYAENWAADGGRRCTACQDWKLWKEFWKSKTGYRGRMARCKTCVTARRRPSLKGVPRAARALPPGLTLAGAEAMAREQQGQCAVCPDRPSRLVPDWDRTTGHIRQLLCQRCAQIIEVLENDPGLLGDLRAYLQLHTEVGDNDGGTTPSRSHAGQARGLRLLAAAGS